MVTSQPLRIAVASSGLGHIARGIEAWASDLGAALAARGLPATLYKGGGVVERPFERVIPCWERHSDKTKRLLHWLPRRFVWRFHLSSPYDIEQMTFARRKRSFATNSISPSHSGLVFRSNT